MLELIIVFWYLLLLKCYVMVLWGAGGLEADYRMCIPISRKLHVKLSGCTCSHLLNANANLCLWLNETFSELCGDWSILRLVWGALQTFASVWLKLSGFDTWLQGHGMWLLLHHCPLVRQSQGPCIAIGLSICKWMWLALWQPIRKTEVRPLSRKWQEEHSGK